MLKKFLAIAVGASLIFSASPSIAAGVKAGQACEKIGTTSGLGKLTLTCTSSGKNFVWTKGIAKSLTYKPTGLSVNRCDSEPGKLPTFVKNIQDYISSLNKCVGLVRIGSMTESKIKPSTKLFEPASNSNVTSCKIQAPATVQSWKGFPSPGKVEEFNLERHPSPTTVMQVIPISAPDAPSGSKSPYQDYKYYFDSLKQYFTQINDGPGNIEIKIPDNYIPFAKNIAPYQVEHGKDNALSNQFATDVIATVDSQFDFSKLNYVLIIVPAGTPSGVIGQQGWGGIMSQEGRLPNVSVAQPATFSGPNNTKTPEMASLGMWIHEFYHPGINLGDNHGDGSGNFDENRGIGDWGLMSRASGDLLAWQKWLLGFAQDSQVACISDKGETSIIHLAPSSVRSKKHKLVVIPVGATKVLVLESIRSVGLSYKYSPERAGVLAYTVDSADPRHEYGYTIMYPDDRKPPYFVQEGNMYTNASIKYGESITYGGMKVTNVEWGDFGDVIKVEPVK